MPKGAWESKSTAKEKQFLLENCVNTVSLLEKSIKEHANNGDGRLKDLEKNEKALKSQMISDSRTSRVYDDSWIIDSSATDHMTSKSQLFHTYTLNPSNKKIAVANDSLATIVGTRLGEEDWTDKERKGLYHLESSQKASNNLSLSFLNSLNKIPFCCITYV
ncbi:hypothetical protein CK203_093796 [Vitis vinifera]|uniref:Retrovirus-related Pol polyprotein from transposon TNT 1-94-like beta-barrel domain-containing protein n=1 Tax=Vitis vinifera TaxID=29760 RepID=A0A438C8S1_VITVI|nr:hypothetical protein CK203_093796 [Vitis vinifera]